MGALNAGDLNVSGNSSIYAYVDDGEGGNSKCAAIDVSYVTTIKDNAKVVAKGSRHEAFITGYLTIEGGSVKAENVGTGYQYIYGKNKDKIRIENAQYPALKVTDINLAMYGIKKIPPKLTISNAKVEIYSELGYGILEQETGVHSQKIDGKWVDDVHTELVDNLEIYNSTVIVRIGADAKSIAPVKMEDTDGGTIIADNCTVYAGAAEDGSDAKASAKAAFLTTGSRYVQLVSDSYAGLDAERENDTVTVSATVGTDAAEQAALLIVRYDAAGKLMGMYRPTLDLSAGTQTITAAFADAAGSDTYKVFLFNGTSYVPMNAAIEP